jgi:hypothetical protein
VVTGSETSTSSRWTEQEIVEGCREFLKHHNERARHPISGRLALDFLQSCRSTGLNPLYDGVVAYPSAGRLVYIVEHDTYARLAAETGELMGIRSGTRVREDKRVIAFATVLRQRPGRNTAEYYAELDVEQWKEAHARSPFWKSRPQSMCEKCCRVMALKLGFSDRFVGLRDDVTSVLYDRDEGGKEDG